MRKTSSCFESPFQGGDDLAAHLGVWAFLCCGSGCSDESRDGNDDQEGECCSSSGGGGDGEVAFGVDDLELECCDGDAAAAVPRCNKYLADTYSNGAHNSMLTIATIAVTRLQH